MSWPINITFKGVSSIGDDFLLNILESNFKMYLDWSFLNIGAWIDVNSTNATIYGQNNHYKLLPVLDPSYEEGRVWQGIRKDWVWENTVDYEGTSPIIVNSAIINSISVPKTDNFFIDYPNGRIVLNDSINTTSTVNLRYSYRYVQVYRSCDVPWFNLLQYGSFDTSNRDIQRTEDGDYTIGSYHRIQMPCIIVDAVPRARSYPYELGNDNLRIEQDIAFYVLAETKNDRNKLLDILRLQQDGFVYLFNTNKLAENEEFPLDYRGDVRLNHIEYPEISSVYAWRKCWIKSSNLVEIGSPHPNLYQGAVRFTTEIISH